MQQTRFTVLTDRLIRCEYHPEGQFEDRATQWVVSREFPEVQHSRQDLDDRIIIETNSLALTCLKDPALPSGFHSGNLSITLKSGVTWHFGDANQDNLGGTARTLDECDGPMDRRHNKPHEMHPGIFSRAGWAILDDAKSLVLNEQNLPVDRGTGSAIQDFYFFAYENDFPAGLRDFYTLTGKPPLLPKWALGLWWSRWAKYRDTDLRRIVEEFDEHNVPLSTLVIDMDWHIVKNPHTNGWTGYTWNSEFFAEPKAFFEHIHSRGIRACLNLHPASGVHPHESAYREFAEFMGADPESQAPILFNPTDPKFLEGYFRFLHHPHEELGVDFWWIDWQQGKKTPFGDVDPLWVLNHLHSRDLARDGRKRPFTFSRWCGAGAHRYPIGFSGDTYRTWRTLAWEVEFTAMASNLGFGWWSHDIGGFARGLHDDELYLRWVQFGVLSPIFRFHNAGDPTVDHRPWSKDSRFCHPTLEALRLRRALLPYIYTHAKINADGGLPLVRPMYYQCDDPQAHQWPGQFFFGHDLLAAPVTSPAHPETNSILHPVWLPTGDWCEFFSGAAFSGNRVHGIQATLDTLPLFTRAGSIIPLMDHQQNSTELVCFPGESGSTEIYLDDGESLDYQQGQFAQWRVSQRIEGDHWSLSVERIDGEFADNNLKLAVILRGWDKLQLTDLRINGETEPEPVLREDTGDVSLQLGTISPDGLRLEATLTGTRRAKPAPTQAGCTQLLAGMPLDGHFARPLLDNWEKTLASPANLQRYACDFTDAQIQVLVNYLYDAGAHIQRVAENRYNLVWWNGSTTHPLHVRLSSREECNWVMFTNEDGGVATKCGSHSLVFKSAFHNWRLETDLLGVATIVERHSTVPQ